MPRERYNIEEVNYKLCEADVLLGQCRTAPKAYKQLGVSD